MGAPIIGVFLLAGLVPFSNVYGAFFGILSGFAVGAWVSFGAYALKPDYPKLPVSAECYNITTSSFDLLGKDYKLGKEASNLSGFNTFYGLAFAWYATVGMLTTIIVGIIVSLITGGSKLEFNRDHMLTRCFYKKKSPQKSDEISLENIRL
jgi:hypothetical protein